MRRAIRWAAGTTAGLALCATAAGAQRVDSTAHGLWLRASGGVGKIRRTCAGCGTFTSSGPALSFAIEKDVHATMRVGVSFTHWQLLSLDHGMSIEAGGPEVSVSPADWDHFAFNAGLEMWWQAEKTGDVNFYDTRSFAARAGFEYRLPHGGHEFAPYAAVAVGPSRVVRNADPVWAGRSIGLAWLEVGLTVRVTLEDY